MDNSSFNKDFIINKMMKHIFLVFSILNKYMNFIITIIHIRNLKQASYRGFILIKVYRAIKFNDKILIGILR